MKGYIAFLLPESERERLLEQFKPAYENVVAHHVTHKFGVSDSEPLPSFHNASIIGYADDKQGCQALVVEINGSVDRPDGRLYHITWSLADGRKPVESNDVVNEYHSVLHTPIAIQLDPAFIAFSKS